VDFILKVDFIQEWSPLLGALGAVAVALPLVVGRPNPRRAALSLAVAAVVALLVELVAIFTVLSIGLLHGPEVIQKNPLYLPAYAVYLVADIVVGLLAIAAWALVLYAAAQSGNRARIVAFTVMLTLALVVQIALTNSQIPLLAWLRDWAAVYHNPNPQWANTLVYGLAHVAAVAALACACFLPVAPTTPEAMPPAAPTD
jgi:hypothetical protein